MSLWEGMPEDIVDQILSEIVLLSDLIRFGAVCKSWYSVFLQRKQHRIRRCKNEVPLLLYTQLENVTKSEIMFNIFHRMCCSSMSPVTSSRNLKNTWRSRLISAEEEAPILMLVSSYGWVATVSLETQEVFMKLINPFTGNIISLPTFPEEEEDTLSLVVLSCDPRIYPDKCVVAFLGDQDIWITRLCGNKWTRFRITPEKLVITMLFHKGQLYALHQDWDLLAIDCLRESNNNDTCDFGSCYVVKTTSRSVGFNVMHLVESVNGELLMIASTYDYTKFKVYKLMTDDDGKQKKGHWDQYHRLYGDQVLFLSEYNAICSKSRNLQADSIYFISRSDYKTKDNYSHHHMLVVSLDEERKPKKEPIKLGVELDDDFGPFWINPTLQ